MHFYQRLQECTLTNVGHYCALKKEEHYDKKQFVVYRNLVNMEIQVGDLINKRLLNCSDIITLILNIPRISSYPCLLMNLLGTIYKWNTCQILQLKAYEIKLLVWNKNLYLKAYEIRHYQ